MKTLNLTDHGAVRVIEMDRSEVLNAFNGQLMDDLAEAFAGAAEADSIKVLVLTGAGRAFTAGADLKAMGQPAPTPKHGLSGMLDAIVEFPKPFMIAVNGVGAGIGATICGLGDLVFMAEGARLRCPFSALGLTAEAGSTLTFPRLMGHQQASWFLLSSEWMSAQECVAAGLAMAAVPDAELMPQVMSRAQTLAALPLASLVKTKSLLAGPVRETLKATFRAENKGLAELMGGAANREALAAFRDKRAPDFTGL